MFFFLKLELGESLVNILSMNIMAELTIITDVLFDQFVVYLFECVPNIFYQLVGPTTRNINITFSLSTLLNI